MNSIVNKKASRDLNTYPQRFACGSFKPHAAGRAENIYHTFATSRDSSRTLQARPRAGRLWAQTLLILPASVATASASSLNSTGLTTCI